jgi:DNA gyrase subunit B
MTKKVEKQYNAEHIEVLEGLEPVRLRPTMYVLGGLDQKSLQHLIIECVNNSTDEFMAGYGKKITITLQSDGGINVADEGRGIPVDLHPIHKKSALELVMTTLHAGGKFDKENYKISSGINGVGISVCCGLSKYLEARVCRDGFEWLQKYEKGKPTTSVDKIKKSNKTGTSILFYPDNTILHDIDVKTEILTHKMMELSFLCPGLTIEIFDERDGENYSYFSKEGIQSLVKFLNEDKDSLFPNKPLFFDGTVDDVGVEIAFQYADQSRDFILSYCNTVSTTDAGRHERGFKSGLTRIINTFARNQKLLKDKDTNLEGDDIRDGLTAIVSVHVRQPLFEGQSKSRLANEEVEPAVSQLITEKLTAYLDQDPSLGKRIVERALTAQRARAAAKSASEAIKKKSGSFGMASKLAKCRSKNAEECELFLVEGDSAAGPAKRTRDSRTQAILPLRGKVINALKCRLDELLKNNEIQTLIYALGTGIANTNLNGDEEDSLFDITKINYHKLILAADSDADGNHIQSLLLTFLFTYLRPLVEAGYVYIAKAPLFKVTVGSGKSKAKYYALDEKELEILNKKYPSGKVTRFKGLGEMDDDELAETTINPKTRTIVQVEIDSLGAASKMFSDLMGKSAAPRKEYLAKHASKHFKRIFESEAF